MLFTFFSMSGRSLGLGIVLDYLVGFSWLFVVMLDLLTNVSLLMLVICFVYCNFIHTLMFFGFFDPWDCFSLFWLDLIFWLLWLIYWQIFQFMFGVMLSVVYSYVHVINFRMKNLCFIHFSLKSSESETLSKLSEKQPLLNSLLAEKSGYL